ncbi:MAG: hypothetical protein B9S32_08790 [Verrucomicrobia bacterium Tous-C9LFEB]|nr:MAG: hypothetical protein B9S32_08790 [Verrucomicrobia bacterium Tous-C9LFEB]
MHWYPELLSYAWMLAAIAALCIGLAKAGLGGFGMLTVLFMAEVLPARESTGVVLPLLIVGDLFAVHAYRHHAQWRYIRHLLAPALVGIGMGYLAMNAIPDKNFKHVMGWIILGLTLLQWSRQFFNEATITRLAHTHVFGYSMGGLGGASTMMANAAGPVMSLYFLAVNLPKYELIGTAAWFFLIVNVTKIPFSAHLGLINFTSMALVAMLAPFVVIGIGVGKAVIHLVPQKVFEWLLLVTAAAGAIRLICS